MKSSYAQSYKSANRISCASSSVIHTVLISPPRFIRQAYVMPVLLSFLFFLSFLLFFFLSSFLTVAWSKEISETTRPISPNSQTGRHVGIDVQSGIGFPIRQGTLPWQPIVGSKLAQIGDMPSFLGLAFHNRR